MIGGIIMKKEIKELSQKSKRAVEEVEEKFDALTDSLADEAKELWSDLKKNFEGVKQKLSEVDLDEHKDKLKANLDVLEARQKLEKVKGSAEEFTKKITAKTEEELDVASLRAHLAKMEAEDLWEEKRKKLSYDFQEKEHELQKMAKEAGEEIKDYFEKLSSLFSSDESKKA